jgi:hypothetical protein
MPYAALIDGIKSPSALSDLCTCILVQTQLQIPLVRSFGCQLGEQLPPFWVAGTEWVRADSQTTFLENEICLVERSNKTRVSILA